MNIRLADSKQTLLENIRIRYKYIKSGRGGQWRSRSVLGVGSRDQGGSEAGPVLGESFRATDMDASSPSSSTIVRSRHCLNSA